MGLGGEEVGGWNLDGDVRERGGFRGGEMGQWWILGAYLSLCPLLLTLLLCGDRPVFKGTIVQRAHDFLTGGGCDLCQ